jgi:hypothetical protein
MNNFNFIEGVKNYVTTHLAINQVLFAVFYNGYSKFANISNTEFIEN